MQQTLMKGLTEQDIQVVVNSYTLHDYYYPTLFPLKENNSLSWKILEARTGLKIAADLVSRGSTIPRKIRESISRIQGDIPKFSISREKNEDELTEYDIMLARTQGSADLKALVEFWAEDTKFCWEGISARLEWVALQQISQGFVRFTNANNSSAVTEYDVDYSLPEEHRLRVEASYSAGREGKPLSVDFPKVIKQGRKEGITFKYAFMNLDTFAKFVNQEEVVRACSTLADNLAGFVSTPDLEAINSYLARQKATFRGLQIVIIDQEITIELSNGERKTENPFVDDVILFSESNVLGNTFWKKPIDINLEGSSALKVMREHILIKKFSNEEPVQEVTQGITNAFPAWALAGRSILLSTEPEAKANAKETAKPKASK